MKEILTDGISLLFIVAFVIACIAFVGWILFSLFQFITQGPAQQRWERALRHPDFTGVETVCGYPLPQGLKALYADTKLLFTTEFSLVNGDKSWDIGGFLPLTTREFRWWRKIIQGIPIASDLSKGCYFVTAQGAVMLESVELGRQSVAPDVVAFMQFKIEFPKIDDD